jgi:hypothetical protein
MLTRGQFIRLSNERNEPFTGMVALASGSSVMVLFEMRAIRMNGGGISLTAMLPLIVDVENERVDDLWGNEWFVEVQADN